MTKPSLYTAIGLMSGTSMDGIDLALLETDGHTYVAPMGGRGIPYEPDLREAIRSVVGRSELDAQVKAVERDVTLAQAAAVKSFLEDEGLDPRDINLIGFHGQTIFHAPERGLTRQIGDGALMAAQTGIDVINDFRSNDVRAGGQGAPLLPLYHRARVRAAEFDAPVVVLNIGGVSNVTWIGPGEEDMIAFDSGPGNALIDDAILNRTGESFDRDGRMARQGQPNQLMVDLWMNHDFFTRQPPKSLDRNAWKVTSVERLSTVDALATLTEFTVQANIKARDFFPIQPQEWLVAGGGRHNRVLIEGLQDGLGIPVRPVDALGWDGDLMEAEGFAYLAVRSLLELPLSLPTTTGVPKPLSGGVLYKA